MKISDIRVVGKQLVLASPEEVDALALRLWITFPDGYREFVTRIGEGVLGGLVRIYPPWRIEKDLQEWRHRINKYWFWDEGCDLLPKERALECVIIGDTVNGDELVFHPARPKRLFVLPRSSNQVFETGADLLAAIEWLCLPGEWVEPLDKRDFEPFDSRAKVAGGETEGSAIDPEGESIDHIVELAERWADRHAVRKSMQEELRKRTGKGGKAAEIIYEGISIDGQCGAGYGAAWRIVDKESGRLLGVFHWRKGDGSESSRYEPA